MTESEDLREFLERELLLWRLVDEASVDARRRVLIDLLRDAEADMTEEGSRRALRHLQKHPEGPVAQELEDEATAALQECFDGFVKANVWVDNPEESAQRFAVGYSMALAAAGLAAMTCAAIRRGDSKQLTSELFMRVYRCWHSLALQRAMLIEKAHPPHMLHCVARGQIAQRLLARVEESFKDLIFAQNKAQREKA